MIENKDIRYYGQDWKERSELYIGLILLPILWIIGPIFLVYAGISSRFTSISSFFEIIMAILCILAGLMFSPYQPVRIKWNDLYLIVKYRFVWGKLTLSLSDIDSWTFSKNKPFIVFKLKDKKRQINYNSRGWFWLPVRGIQEEDLNILLKFLEMKIKREEWDIGLVS